MTIEQLYAAWDLIGAYPVLIRKRNRQIRYTKIAGPLTVLVKPDMPDEELIERLRELANRIKDHEWSFPVGPATLEKPYPCEDLSCEDWSCEDLSCEGLED